MFRRLMRSRVASTKGADVKWTFYRLTVYKTLSPTSCTISDIVETTVLFWRSNSQIQLQLVSACPFCFILFLQGT